MAFHRYVVFDSRNTEESLTVFYRLSLIASALASAGAALLHYFAGLTGIAIVFTPPATVVIYRYLAGLTTETLWKGRFKPLLGVMTPCVAKSWTARISKTESDGTILTDEGIFSIEQTWRMLSITLDTPQTESESTTASLILDANRLQMKYEYYAKKKTPGAKTFEDHVGTATLTIKTVEGVPDWTEPATLTYFTNHGQFGTAVLSLRA